MQPKHNLFFALATLLLACGCASSNINPPQARAHTGYVDLYSSTDAELCWEVREGNSCRCHFSTVFSNVKPVEDDVLRLAFRPGRHFLRITFLNRAVKSPADVDVDIQDGKVTPVQISLKALGSTTVLSKQTTMGGTPAGRAGRRTKINSTETSIFEISAVAEAAVPYQPRKQMPYSQ